MVEVVGIMILESCYLSPVGSSCICSFVLAPLDVVDML